MGRPRAAKSELESKTFLDGAIYLYRRSASIKGWWDIRLKIYGRKGYLFKGSATANEHEAFQRAYDLYLDCTGKKRAGRNIDSKRISVALEAFVKDHEHRSAPADFKVVVSIARQLKEFVGKRTFDDLNTVLVTGMLDYIATNGRKGAVSANTQRRNLTRCKTILKWCAQQGYLEKLPTMPRLTAEKHRRPHFSETDWLKLTDTMPEFALAQGVATKRDRLMLINWVWVLYLTGLRTGEARRLRWEDIRPIVDPCDQTRINVALNVSGKTGRRTTVASSGDVRSYFGAILELRRTDLQNPASDIFQKNDVPSNGLIFAHPDGTPIRSFKKSFLALLKMACVTHSPDGLARTPYSLRHTYATARLNNGVQEYHLARNMGTSVAMLEQHYGHTSNTANVRELTKQALAARAGIATTLDLDWLSGRVADASSN